MRHLAVMRGAILLPPLKTPWKAQPRDPTRTRPTRGDPAHRSPRAGSLHRQPQHEATHAPMPPGVRLPRVPRSLRAFLPQPRLRTLRRSEMAAFFGNCSFDEGLIAATIGRRSSPPWWWRWASFSFFTTPQCSPLGPQNWYHCTHENFHALRTFALNHSRTR